MKFTFVSDTFPPDINGVARTLQVLARGLVGRGHQVSVVTTQEPCSQKDDHIRLTAVGSLPLPGYRGVRLGFASPRYFREHLQREKTNALYVAVESVMGCNAIRAARQLGVRVVSGFHTNFHTYSTDYRLPLLRTAAVRYLVWLHNLTARTLAPSPGTAEQLRQLGIHQVGVLGRGVDAALFHPQRRDPALRAHWGAANDAPVALFVGRIAPEKNLPLAMLAFEQIRTTCPRARCVVVGDGPKEAALRAEHPQVHFAGARTGEDLARHYASADLFIFPSLSETFGNVLIEALASGLVTVSYDYAAAQQHIRHGDNGFTAPLGNEAAFLAQTQQALALWQDPALRTAARHSAATLSWEAIVAQFERELIGEPP